MDVDVQYKEEEEEHLDKFHHSRTAEDIFSPYIRCERFCRSVSTLILRR